MKLKLSLVVLLAAVLSGCVVHRQLYTARDIQAGEVIQEKDLEPMPKMKTTYVGWPKFDGWATEKDLPKVIGHKAKRDLGVGWRFQMSEID